MGVRNKGRRSKISPRVSLRKSVVTGPRDVIEIGRNEECPCGSGEKYKNCCISKGDHFLRKVAKQRAKADAKEKRKESGGFFGILKGKFKKSDKAS